MGKKYKFLAFDFGASSGRAMLATFDGEKITLEEKHRFSNDPVNINGDLHWDVLRLFFEIKQGILKCANSGDRDIDCIGIDTWGVDYGLLDENDKLIGNPYHYRDTRTEGMYDEAFKLVPKEEIFKETGIAFNWFNTIYQLLSAKLSGDTSLKNAKTLLMMPDLFNFFLTGVKKTEYTNASTTQMYNSEKYEWSYDLLKKLGIPTEILTDVIFPGEIVGKVKPELADELGIKNLLEKYPYEVSGGQKQRAAVARAVITQPQLLLADEPTGALDSKAAKELLKLFTSLNQDGQTILMVTHSVKAASTAGRVLFIKDGRVFHQIYKGNLSETQMYQKISDAMTAITAGGEEDE